MFNSKSCADRNLKWLGCSVKEKVTGFTGVVESVSFDLYGCIQVVVAPPMDAKGDIPDSRWFDITRVEKVADHRVMEIPEFGKGYVAEGKKGAANKPIP